MDGGYNGGTRKPHFLDTSVESILRWALKTLLLFLMQLTGKTNSKNSTPTFKG